MARRRKKRTLGTLAGTAVLSLVLIAGVTSWATHHGGLLLAGGGLYGLLWGSQAIYRRRQAAAQTRHTERNAQEKEVVRLAQQRQGALTVAEVVAQTSLTREDAEAMLSDFAARGYVTTQAGGQGATIYVFPLTAPPAAAPAEAQAESPLRCVVTGSLLRNTPEERVRQDAARRLMEVYGYAREDLAIEFPIKMGRHRKRADVVVFFPQQPHAQAHVRIIVEAKAATCGKDALAEAFAQLESYVAASLNCQYAIVAQRAWEVYAVQAQAGRKRLQPIADLPHGS